MSASDPFALDEGAYVLGALEPRERAAFESHLSTCPACRERVRQAEQARDLLATLQAEDLAALDVPPPRPVPVPGAATLQRTLTRRRLLVSAAGLGAAGVVALGAVTAASLARDDEPAGQAMTPLLDTPIRATAALVPKRWGTEISVRCSYDRSVQTSLPDRLVYAVRVVGRDGAGQTLGTWAIERGGTAAYTTGTALAADEIGTVEVVTTSGKAILALER